jgi:large subunit ribosomal protein L15
MKLNDLKPNEGAKKRRQRVGRGIAAGQGKSSGRGTKGEGAREGKGGHLARQGGNLPFYRSLPFMRGEGFTPPHQVEYNEISLTNLSKFKAGTQVTPELLGENNLLHKKGLPIVILGSGEISIPLNIKAHRVTKGAKAKIEAAGGKVELIK